MLFSIIIQLLLTNSVWGSATIYEGLPNEGHLDSFHHPDKVSIEDKVFYALRYQKTTDLIRARKALQDLYTSFPSSKRKLDFTLPKEVVNVFLNPEGVKIHNIGLLKEQLENKKFSVDQRKLEKVLGVLVQATLKVSEIDQMISIISDKSLVNNIELKPKIIEVARDIENARGRISNPFILKNMNLPQIKKLAAKSVHDDFLANERVKTHLSELEGMRSFLLNRYPILDIKRDEKESFYKFLMSKMTKQGFPDPTLILNFHSIILNKKEIEWKDSYQQAMENFLVNNDGEEGSLTKKLFPHIRFEFKKILEIQLKHNTYWLRELNDEIEAEDNLDPLLYLSQNTHSWDLAVESFPFIKKSDWAIAKTYFEMDIRSKENLKEFRQSIMQGAGYALGLVGMISSFIPGGQAIGVPLLAGSAALLTVEAGITYIDSRKYSEMSENLFYSSRDGEELFNKNLLIEIKKADYTNLVLAAALSATSIRLPLAQGLQRVSQSTNSIVNISKDKLIKLTNSVTQSSKLLAKGLGVKLSSSFVNAETRLNQIALNAKFSSTVMAESLGVSYHELRRRFLASSLYERYFIKENLKNVVSTATMNSMLEIGIMLSAEYMTRGDKFEEDLPYVIMNVVAAVGLTFMMDAINVKPIVQKVYRRDQSHNRAMYDKGLTKKERLSIWKRDGTYIAAFTFPIMAAVSGSMEAQQFSKAQENGENPEGSEYAIRAALNTVYMSLFLGILTPPKNQAVYAFENRVLKKKFQSASAQNSVIIPTRLLNLFAGSIAYTASAQALGLQGGDSEEDLAKKMSRYINAEYNFNNSGYLYPEILE